MDKRRIAVLVSGGGTNLQALFDAQDSGIITSGEIVLVISSNDKAYALTRAANRNVKTAVFRVGIIRCSALNSGNNGQ